MRIRTKMMLRGRRSLRMEGWGWMARRVWTSVVEGVGGSYRGRVLDRCIFGMRLRPADVF